MKSMLLMGAVAASLVGLAARADDPDATRCPGSGPGPARERGTPHLLTGIGMTVEAGGGVGGFLESRAVSETTPAGLWNARLTVGSRRHFGGELAYIGSAQNMKMLGTNGSNAHLIGNGVEGAFRFNLLTGMWQPYAVAGIGWIQYVVTNAVANTSDFENRSNVIEVPLGVGVAWRYGGFVADGRLTFHPAAGPNFPTGVNLSTWDLGARLGYEF
jgi:hypothetical protein